MTTGFPSDLIDEPEMTPEEAKKILEAHGKEHEEKLRKQAEKIARETEKNNRKRRAKEWAEELMGRGKHDATNPSEDRAHLEEWANALIATEHPGRR